MIRAILAVAMCGGAILLCACASKVATLSNQPDDTVVVYLTDGQRAEFPAATVTKVVHKSAPNPSQPPPQHVLIQVSREEQGQSVEATQLQGVRIDRGGIDTPDWQEMIALCKELPAIRSGRGQMTLLRVFLEGGTPDSLPQLTSIKLVLPSEGRGGGGGAFKQIHSGDFILVEHINSASRRDGKDPVRIGAFTHRRATLWIEVPRAGTLGVLGDVVLSPCPESEMGRIEATVGVETDGPLTVRELRLGPVAVGGSYGKTLLFGPDRACDTGLIAPGPYKILLPDFDLVKSRWTVNVSPGTVTQLKFLARSQRQIDMVEETEVADTCVRGRR